MGHRHRYQLGEPGHDLDRFQGCVRAIAERGGQDGRGNRGRIGRWGKDLGTGRDQHRKEERRKKRSGGRPGRIISRARVDRSPRGCPVLAPLENIDLPVDRDILFVLLSFDGFDRRRHPEVHPPTLLLPDPPWSLPQPRRPTLPYHLPLVPFPLIITMPTNPTCAL